MVDDNTFSFSEMAPILKMVTIFSGFDEENIQMVCDRCEVVSFDPGAVIIEEGAPATEIYIILSGCVSVVLGLRNEPFELARFGCGNCLGEASVIGIQKHSASALAIEKSFILVLSRAVLMEVFKIDKELFSLLILNIARELARRLYHSNELLLRCRKGESGAGTLNVNNICKNVTTIGEQNKPVVD